MATGYGRRPLRAPPDEALRGVGIESSCSCCGVRLLCGRRRQHPPHNKPPELRQQMVGFVLHSSVLRYSAIYYGLSGECGPVLILRTAGRPDMLLQHFHDFFWRFYESHSQSGARHISIQKIPKKQTLLRARSILLQYHARAGVATGTAAIVLHTHSRTHTRYLDRVTHSTLTHSFKPAPQAMPHTHGPTGTP